MRNTVDDNGFVSDESEDTSLTITCPTLITSLTASASDISIPSTKNTLWVDKNGSDDTGDGTITKPYGTIGKALQQVSSPSITNTYAIQIGAGQFEESTLTIPSYVGVYGRGTGTTKVKAASAGTSVFVVSGSRVRIESMTILGITTGSSNKGVDFVVPYTSYQDTPRIQNLVIRQCERGVYVSGGSSCISFDVKSWDNACCFESDNGQITELYNCTAFQTVEPRASGSVGFKFTADSRDQWFYMWGITSWQNETSVKNLGTGPLAGGTMYGFSHNYESEGVTLQCDHAAKIDFSDVTSRTVTNFDIEQKSANAVVNLRNAALDYAKLSLIAGGENNVTLQGVDVTDTSIMRLRGTAPAIQLKNLNTSNTAGGLRRIAQETAHFCIERNTHASGSFATYEEDLTIDSTGSVCIGELVEFDLLNVSGSIGAREGGTFKAYVPYTAGNYFAGFKAHSGSTESTTYVFPASYPSENAFAMCTPGGYLSWETGSITIGENLQDDFGLYAGKDGATMKFKALVAGSNITLSSDSNTITIDASASGEANTASNLAQFGPYASKDGVDLQFKGLVAGANITLSSDSNTITIDASASGEANTASNLAQFGPYASKDGVDLQFKGLVAGSNITLSSGSNTITIDASASGEANTASNLQDDFGLYASKSGVDLRFKALQAGSGISLSSGSSSVTITSTAGAVSGSNVGIGLGVFSQMSDSTLQFNSVTTQTGSMGHILSASLSDNTISVSRRPCRRTIFREDDFTTSTSAGVLNWIATTNGPGASVAPSLEGIDKNPANAMGVFASTTGTNSAGRAALTTYVNSTRLDFFASTIMEWRVSLSALSTAAQEYVVHVGWIDNAAAGDQVDGVYFEYDRLTAGNFWRICSSANSTRTKVTTSVAPMISSSGFQRLRIETRAGCASAAFYIDDVLVGTLNTNMPVGTGRTTGFGTKIAKSSGATPALLYADYVEVQCDWQDPGR